MMLYDISLLKARQESNEISSQAGQFYYLAVATLFVGVEGNGNDDPHIESQKFRARREKSIWSPMIEICICRNLARGDAVSIGEEGIGPLLQQSTRGSK